MAEENTRPSRGRKKDAATGAAGKAGKTTAKSTAKKTTAKTAIAPRARRAKLVPEPSPEAIAEHAYLLWERGEPGDQTEHWLRAEAELRAA